MGLNNDLLSECLSEQKPSELEEEEEKPSLMDKPLYSMLHRQIKKVADIKKTHQLLEKAGLMAADHGITKTGL